MSRRTTSWSDVKTNLRDVELPGVLGLVQDLNAASKDKKVFLCARFGLGDNVLRGSRRWSVTSTSRIRQCPSQVGLTDQPLNVPFHTCELIRCLRWPIRVEYMNPNHEKFLVNDGLKVIKPQCHHCRHWTVGTLTCKAFPEGIPQGVLMNVIDHRKPIEGDGGIVFEQ